MNRQWLIIGAIILVLLGSYVWNRNKTVTNEQEEVPPVEEIITQEDGTVIKRNGTIIEELSPEQQAQKRQEIDQKLQDTQPITLNPVETQQGLGTTTYSFQEGTFYQKVTLDNLAPLQKGYYYEAWLQKGEELISIGRVEVTGQKGTLYYSAKTDRSDCDKIIISKETEDSNANIGERVLEAQCTK
jgi:hypothetical protein